eukprot:gene57243-biopygen99916
MGLTAQILMELVSGGTIAAQIQMHGSLPAAVTRSYTSQMVAAVAYLHGIGIIHRDLKCANVLLTHYSQEDD